VFLEHLHEQFFAEIRQLFALIAVPFGPDIQMAGTALMNLGQNFAKVQISIHARTNQIAKFKRLMAGRFYKIGQRQ
jgi:uncharacterized membrane protein YccF (DUF307 family)